MPPNPTLSRKAILAKSEEDRKKKNNVLSPTAQPKAEPAPAAPRTGLDYSRTPEEVAARKVQSAQTGIGSAAQQAFRAVAARKASRAELYRRDPNGNDFVGKDSPHNPANKPQPIGKDSSNTIAELKDTFEGVPDDPQRQKDQAWSDKILADSNKRYTTGQPKSDPDEAVNLIRASNDARAKKASLAQKDMDRRRATAAETASIRYGEGGNEADYTARREEKSQELLNRPAPKHPLDRGKFKSFVNKFKEHRKRSNRQGLSRTKQAFDFLTKDRRKNINDVANR